MSPAADSDDAGGLDDGAHGSEGTPDDGGAADSAGQPWRGRHFEAHASADSADDGSPDPDLAAALDRFHSEQAGEDAVVDAFRTARLLIPLVAHAGEIEHDASGLRHDKSQELSIVTVEGPDGRDVLPAFTSVDTMRAWDAAARPIPASGERVALAAAQEQTDLIVLDPGGASTFVLRRPAVWAVAQQQHWVPSHRDPDVYLAFVQSIGFELGVHDVTLLAGDPQSTMVGPELVVRVSLSAGLSQEELDAVLSRLAQRWAADDIIATRVDSLRVQLITA